MKKKIKITFIALIAALYMSGCIITGFTGTTNTVTGTGETENYVFTVGAYSGIKAEGAVNINYYSSPSNIVTLTVQPNLLEYFKIEVTGNDLVIKTTRNIKPGAGKFPTLTVSVPVLNRLEISGICDFITYNKITADSFTLSQSGAGSGRIELDVNSLLIDMSGAGRMDLSGKADTVNYKLSGAGDIDSLSLEARDSTINFSGAGSINVNSTEYLRIVASGAGSILYRGSPQIDLNRSGFISITRVD